MQLLLAVLLLLDLHSPEPLYALCLRRRSMVVALVAFIWIDLRHAESEQRERE
jgi:hypothetical protein